MRGVKSTKIYIIKHCILTITWPCMPVAAGISLGSVCDQPLRDVVIYIMTSLIGWSHSQTNPWQIRRGVGSVCRILCFQVISSKA